MGELSKKIGNTLENYGENLFKNFNWELKVNDLEIKCINNNHKNKKDKQKRTHGIDLLFKYFNPFNNRYEATVIECKNRKWCEYKSSNLTNWIEELLNTIECVSCSSEMTEYLDDVVLTSGILLFHCNDNSYNKEDAEKIKTEITIPRRKTPTMLYLADNDILEKWDSMCSQIKEIKKNNISDFGIIYPSINSIWTKNESIIPEFLFSDYITISYNEKRQLDYNLQKTYEIKNIFCFDKVSNSSDKYLKDMIKKMQLGSYSNSDCKFNIYWYPEKKQDIELIKSFNKEDTMYKYIPLDNRNISRVDYEN